MNKYQLRQAVINGETSGERAYWLSRYDEAQEPDEDKAEAAYRLYEAISKVAHHANLKSIWYEYHREACPPSCDINRCAEHSATSWKSEMDAEYQSLWKAVELGGFSSGDVVRGQEPHLKR